MKKIVLLLVIGVLLILAWFWGRDYSVPQTVSQAVSDIPTEEEQQLIEESQLPPEAIAEQDMEDLSPEDAEHN